MTKEEVKKIIGIIFSKYPGYKPKEEVKDMVKSWTEILSDTTYDDAYTNLVNYIKAGNEYAPNVSQLVNKKKETYGFKGRVYSHSFFEEIEREVEEHGGVY